MFKLFLLRRIGTNQYLSKPEYDYTWTRLLAHARKEYNRKDAERLLSTWRSTGMEIVEFEVKEKQ